MRHAPSTTDENLEEASYFYEVKLLGKEYFEYGDVLNIFVAVDVERSFLSDSLRNLGIYYSTKIRNFN